MSGKVNISLERGPHARLRLLARQLTAERDEFISMSKALDVALDIVEEARKQA